jgi:hypothetical protein
VRLKIDNAFFIKIDGALKIESIRCISAPWPSFSSFQLFKIVYSRHLNWELGGRQRMRRCDGKEKQYCPCLKLIPFFQSLIPSIKRQKLKKNKTESESMMERSDCTISHLFNELSVGMKLSALGIYQNYSVRIKASLHAIWHSIFATFLILQANTA